MKSENKFVGVATGTLNQLELFGTGAGSWDFVAGTIIFYGTNPTFVNQGGSNGTVGEFAPRLQLNADTSFEIDKSAAVSRCKQSVALCSVLKKRSGTPHLHQLAFSE